MSERTLTVNGVRLCAQTFGKTHDPAVLLIAGASSSMDGWDPVFCRRLAEAGRYVIRYDHRDTGRSESYPPGKPGYTGEDLVADAAGLVTALAGGHAHLAGLSAGAGIAQEMAVWHPELVASLTLMSTTAGPAADLPPPAPHMAKALAHPLPDPDWADPVAVVDYLGEVERPFAGPECFDEEQVRRTARRVVERTGDIEAAVKNHWLMDQDGESIRDRLGELSVPTLVIHGSEDPLFPLPHGEALAREIPGARLLVLDGVGHQPPPPSTWDTVVAAMVAHTAAG